MQPHPEFQDNTLPTTNVDFVIPLGSNPWIKEWKEMQRMHDVPKILTKNRSKRILC